MSPAAPPAHDARRPAPAPPLAIHLVGSVPPAVGGDPDRAMNWLLDHSADSALTALPFEPDSRWIIDWLDQLVHVDALEQVRPGASRGYDDIPSYRIRPGHELNPHDLALGRHQHTADAIAAHDRLAATRPVPARVQVSVPNSLDRAMFAAGSPAAAQQWMPAMQKSLISEVVDLVDTWGERLQLQLESPAVLASYHHTPREDWPALTTQLVHQVAEVLSAASRASWILHLCYGDLEHQPLFTPTDLDAAVLFLNALNTALVSQDQPMPPVHIPMCHGNAEPPTEPKFYRPLKNLQDGISVIPGIVAENHPSATANAAQIVIGALGSRVVALGAACGLGRRSPTAAAANMHLATELVTIQRLITP